MARRAELEVAIKNGDAAARELEKLNRKLDDVGKTGEKAFKSIGKEMGEMVKGGAVAAVAGQFASLYHGITSGATTSFSGAIEQAKAFRSEYQRIAIGTGQDFEKTRQQIEQTSKSIGELPDRVFAFGKSVQSLTGDWKGAMNGIEAYQSRALQLNKTIDQMGPAAAMLKNLFNIEDSQKAATYFATLDTQAKRLGLSVQQTDSYVQSMMSNMARITGGSAEKNAAISSTFLAMAGGNPEKAQRLQGGMTGWIEDKAPIIERQMRRRGALGKGESVYDENGNINPEMMARMIEFKQGQFAHGNEVLAGRSWSEKMRIFKQSGMPPEVAAQWLKLKKGTFAPAMGADAKPDLSPLASFLGAPGVEGSIQKWWKDTGLGEMFTPAADAVTAEGGGLRGIGLGALGMVGLGGAGHLYMRHLAGMTTQAKLAAEGGGAAANAAGAAGKAGPGLLRRGVTALAGAMDKRALANMPDYLREMTPAQRATWNALTPSERAASMASRAGGAAMKGLGFLGTVANVATILSMSGDNALSPEAEEDASPAAFASRNRWRKRLGPLGPLFYGQAPVSGGLGDRAKLDERDMKTLAGEIRREVAGAVLKVQVIAEPPAQDKPKPGARSPR